MSWKDSVLNTIPILTGNKEHGKWNREYNHYLGHHNLYPYLWQKSIQQVYTDLTIGKPASEYILTSLYNYRDNMVNAYEKVKEVTDTFVLQCKYNVCHGVECHG
jgi:hypothetical protein